MTPTRPSGSHVQIEAVEVSAMEHRLSLLLACGTAFIGVLGAKPFDDWKGYASVEHRCLGPFNRFSEPMKLADSKSGNAWFAFGKEVPVSYFAGLRTSWRGTRRKDEGPMDHEVFAFLTTSPNVEVAAVHVKAMQVILTKPEEWNVWLREPWTEVKAPQRPLPDGSL